GGRREAGPCWSGRREAGALRGWGAVGAARLRPAKTRRAVGRWPERGAFIMTDQDDLLRRAALALPGGLLGNHRSGAGLEFVVKEGRGAYLWDMNGRRYLDYLLGSGPMLLGHA